MVATTFDEVLRLQAEAEARRAGDLDAAPALLTQATALKEELETFIIDESRPT